MFLPFTPFSVSLRTMLKHLYHETRKNIPDDEDDIDDAEEEGGDVSSEDEE